MKKLATLIFSSLIFTTIQAQNVIVASDARDNLGKTVTICDSIYSTKKLKGLTLLNLGGDYPRQKLTVVIYKSAYANFPYAVDSLLRNRFACITGKIVAYKGKLQMVLTKPKEMEY